MSRCKVKGSSRFIVFIMKQGINYRRLCINIPLLDQIRVVLIISIILFEVYITSSLFNVCLCENVSDIICVAIPYKYILRQLP